MMDKEKLLKLIEQYQDNFESFESMYEYYLNNYKNYMDGIPMHYMEEVEYMLSNLETLIENYGNKEIMRIDTKTKDGEVFVHFKNNDDMVIFDHNFNPIYGCME